MNTRSSEIYFVRANKTKFGGAEVYLSRLSKALNSKKIKHKIVHSMLPKFLPSWLRTILFNLQVCIVKRGKFYFSLDRISCPDIYRAGDGVHRVFLSVEKKSKSNLLHPVYLFLERRCFNNARYIVANSNMIKQQIINTYDIASEKIKVIYNGIESKKIDYQSAFSKISSEFSINENQPIVLYVGSGFKRKGLKEFLQIISNLNNTEIKAFVIGKEKNIEQYQNLTKKLNIDNQVVFTGPREDVDDFYTIGDIFLFPTHYEPFSNVVLEAMNFENVVFTTAQNGASEILDEYFIMKQPDDFSVVLKIQDLLNHDSKLKNIKADNRLKSKQFSIEKNLEETLGLIATVTN
ncbi:MAG: glycosyltransferase family 4 protein [Gammaproteobacteria bacterium]|nr:glycosyltransferase family 4 protein [Gammaproteobacteria bacterium]